MPRSSSRFRPLILRPTALLFTAVASPVLARPNRKPSRSEARNGWSCSRRDGMRPDLVEKYAKAGAMPTYKELMKHGATGDNGMLQAFPPNTGVGWYTMATGTYPAEHGSTNNTFFRAGDAFSEPDVVLRPPACSRRTRSRTRPSGRARRSRRSTGSAASRRTSTGPTVDFTNFFSNRGVLVGAADPVEQAGSAFFGVTYQVATLVTPAAGWSGVPAGDPAAPPKETTWTINSTFAAQNPNRTYNVYFYDSVVGRRRQATTTRSSARSARRARRRRST